MFSHHFHYWPVAVVVQLAAVAADVVAIACFAAVPTSVDWETDEVGYRHYQLPPVVAFVRMLAVVVRSVVSGREKRRSGAGEHVIHLVLLLGDAFPSLSQRHPVFGVRTTWSGSLSCVSVVDVVSLGVVVHLHHYHSNHW